MQDKRLKRLDSTRCLIANKSGVDATLFANEEVPVEAAALDELLGFLQLQRTIEQLSERAPGFLPPCAKVERVAVTPDFHKGAGIPIGTVLATNGFIIPAAVGNDINCGMRLHVTTLTADKVSEHLDQVETKLRHVFFEGGRDIAMTRVQREALLREGLTGLLASVPASQTQGQWRAFHEHSERELASVERKGSLSASRIIGLESLLGRDGLSRDSQIGSIGGGNHFVELQRIEKILDGQTAHAWGLRPGQVTIMVHTGSVSVGHQSAGFCRNLVRGIYPQGLKHPENGVYVLPDSERFQREVQDFWDALHNAANFAHANRLFLALMALESLRSVLGEADMHLVYDAPHNLVRREQTSSGTRFLHRKGACPARGMDSMAETRFAFHGEPVLVPGSMGASSFVLAGLGNSDALSSASHGAGRVLSRGEALKVDQAAFTRFMREFRVVTPVDFRRTDVRQRRAIVDRKLEDIKKEAPYAYKGIGPIIRTLTDAGIARPVAELRPLLTVKG